MTNIELIDKLKNIEANYKNVYSYGVFGQTITNSLISQKAEQYPSWYTSSRIASLKKLVGLGYFGFDCVNLIKAVLWGWNGKSSSGGAKYLSNNVPDVNADTAINLCSDVSSNFSDIEPGEAVWLSGHIGIYIGDGLVIECSPKWENKTQITALKNMGSVSGYNSRTWTKRGKLPWIEYVKSEEPKKGDIVNYFGGYNYPSSTSLTALGDEKTAGSAEVTSIKSGAAHPYHIIGIKGGSNVYGWVDKTSISVAN